MVVIGVFGNLSIDSSEKILSGETFADKKPSNAILIMTIQI
jgi:hypothetical protein